MMRVPDLEGERGVIRLFLAHFLVGKIRLMLHAGFPKALPQRNNRHRAVIARGVGKRLRFHLVRFTSIAGVKAVNVALTSASAQPSASLPPAGGPSQRSVPCWTFPSHKARSPLP